MQASQEFSQSIQTNALGELLYYNSTIPYSRMSTPCQRSHNSPDM